VHLGRHHVLLTGAEEPAEQPTGDDLALAAVVDVGGVEEDDAALDGPPDDRPGRRLVQRPRAALVRAEAHHPQAHARDAQAGVPQVHVPHGCLLGSSPATLPVATEVGDQVVVGAGLGGEAGVVAGQVEPGRGAGADLVQATAEVGQGDRPRAVGDDRGLQGGRGRRLAHLGQVGGAGAAGAGGRGSTDRMVRSRPSRSGGSTSSRGSSRPGRRSSASTSQGCSVAATTNTPSCSSLALYSSATSWSTTPRPMEWRRPARRGPIASSWSRYSRQGALARAVSKISWMLRRL